MKKSFCYILTIFAILAMSPNAFADSIVGSGGWQTWTTSDQDGAPYWDHTSSDGANKNVGFYLTNTGAFTGSTTGPGAIPFWGNAYNSGNDTGGTAVTSFSFTSTGSSQAALKIEIAGLANTNVFGWYETASGTTHQIFSGPDSAGATATFTPTSSYGFYFSTADGIFKTQAGSNSAYVNEQHFAVFQGADGFWLGMEDQAFFHSDEDYNDMIVKVSPVPEPMTSLLLGLGLVGLAGARRFKK
jgi:hypothetical protein